MFFAAGIPTLAGDALLSAMPAAFSAVAAAAAVVADDGARR
ncbi:hypothetical protein [Actinomadura sp. GC306]|nr:hypothetical protein [Actinomadura sp. GC306]